MNFLTSAQAVEFLRQQEYPLPPSPGSARTHLLRLGDRGLEFSVTAGGHRRYTEADLTEFLRSNSQRNGKGKDDVLPKTQ